MTRRQKGEEGAVLLFVVGWTTVVLVATGLLWDGGTLLAAQRRAYGLAELAALTGSREVVDGGASAVIDPERATARVQDYLGAANAASDGWALAAASVATEPERVTVTVTMTQPRRILGLFGFGSVEVVGVGRAEAQQGTAAVGD
ncbi:MAG: hypothetical protein ACRD0F_00095 [Acidimicrobiales bacterium]